MEPSSASHRQLLEFLLAAGVDIAIGDAPVNRLAPPAPAPVSSAGNAPESAARPNGGVSRDTRAGPSSDPARPPAVLPFARPAPASPDEAVMAARQLAASAPDLPSLEALLRDFDGCALKTTASRLVFADGRPGARLMIVGEAPGREEDETGRPFVGRAGQLLDRMLNAIGLDRSEVYIANIVPWRPPGNRTPTPQEIAVCLPFIRRQIELARPVALLTMGAPASQTLLGQKDGILRLRGRWFEFADAGRTIPALATLHPAYLLRQPAAKALAWRDLRALKARLAADSSESRAQH